VLIFGIGPSSGFRMTDLRVWACQRSLEDIKIMMHEYLEAAEIKKKLKVNIRVKTTGGLLPPPIRSLPQPESKKKGFVLSPPPQSPNRTDNTTSPYDDGDDERLDSAFIPGFADFTTQVSNNNIEPPEVMDSPKEEGEESGVYEDPLEGNTIQAEDTEVISMASLTDLSVDKQLSSVEEASHEAERELEDDEVPMQSSIVFSDLLSTNVRKSAAAAIIRGPPAARHFGGSRGGLLSEHVHCGSKCDGVSPIAICGQDKSIVWFSDDREPPGRTYPIGASGAILSDVMDKDQSEYMCCFLAKEKQMVLFELSRKTVVVELQMKTKLNFWRYLPPESHGSDLAFSLITPVGGFHWKPLDESPRPCQVWKRGPELEGKKILAYEEGGSNGLTGTNARSTIALVLASSATPRSTTVEAYCISMYDGLQSALCISNVIVGAALYLPTSVTPPSHFLPYVITISKDVTSQYVLDIEDLVEQSGTLDRGNIIASIVLDVSDANKDELFEPPSMSMGSTPEVLCCCHEGFIAVAIRREGLVVVYDFSTDNLALVGQSRLGQYIVDAAIRSNNVDTEAELILLLCESDDPKDGRIANMRLSRADGVTSQYLSSI